jgi:hypothetical protein
MKSGPASGRAPSNTDRRGFLKRGVALSATLVTVGRSVAGLAQSPPADPSKTLGAAMEPYGARSRLETASRKHRPPSMPEEYGGNLTPLDETLGVITPSALHFEGTAVGFPRSLRTRTVC